MASRYLLAVDLGTTGPRCVVTTTEGRVVANARTTYDLHTPEDAPELARELLPDQLWNQVRVLISEAVTRSNVSPGEVLAVGVTGQRQGFALLDANGDEVYLGPNLDLRGVFQGAALDETHADAIYHTTGHLPSFLFPISKLLWFREHRPRQLSRAKRLLSLPAWLAYRLTGEVWDESALVGELGLLDLRRRDVARGLLEELGVEPALLPPLKSAGTLAGAVTAAAAPEGLLPGTAVTLAGPDAQAALAGMGVVEPGQTGIVAGWSTPVQRITDSPILDEARRTWTGTALHGGRWVLEANAGDTGAAVSWLAEQVFTEGGLDALSAAATAAKRGSDQVVAFLGSRPLDLARVGLGLGGFLFPVPLTFQRIAAGSLARAALENVAYAVRGCVERIEGIVERPATSLHLGGGFSLDRLFPQLLADVLGRPLSIHSAQASAVGAAAAAGLAAECWDSLTEAAGIVGPSRAQVFPQREATIDYQEHYERWQELLQNMELLSKP